MKFKQLNESKSINEVNEGIDGWDNRTGVIKRIDKYLYDNPEATPPKGYIQKGSRAYDDAVNRYGNYVTTPFCNISTDDLMQYARENKLLSEASYGMIKEMFKNKYFNESINLSEEQNESANESSSEAILYIEVMSGVNADGFTAIVKDSISGEEIFRQTYYYGYDASYDRRWANSRKPYVTDIINDLKSRYNVSNVEVTAGKNLFRGDSMSSDSVEKFKNKYLNESISLSDDQLDKAMELVDEIYEACKSIYSYNENGKFEEGLNLNGWSIYAAAIDLHDLIEHESIKESLEEDDNSCSFYEGDQLEWVSLSGVKYKAVVAETSEDYITLDLMSLGGKPERKSFELTVDPEGRECIIVDVAPNKRNAVYVYPECEVLENNIKSSNRVSLQEAYSDETPWSYKEVEDALKSLSNNWRDEDGVCRCWYKEEKQRAVKILRKHYKIVETSQDGDWTVIAFETPIQKESI